MEVPAGWMSLALPEVRRVAIRADGVLLGVNENLAWVVKVPGKEPLELPMAETLKSLTRGAEAGHPVIQEIDQRFPRPSWISKVEGTDVWSKLPTDEFLVLERADGVTLAISVQPLKWQVRFYIKSNALRRYEEEDLVTKGTAADAALEVDQRYPPPSWMTEPAPEAGPA